MLRDAQAHDKAIDRQRKQRHAFEKVQSEAWTALEASFRVASFRAQDSAKKLTSLKGQCTTLRLGRDLLEDEVLLASSS